MGSLTKKSSKYSIKCVIMGDTGVGKSSIVLRLLRNEFRYHQDTTIGIAFNQIKFPCKNNCNETYSLELWDTAGQERYDSLMPLYYRGAQIIIIVHDLCCPETFERGKKIHRQIKKATNYNDNILFIILGNKSDQVVIGNNKQIFSEDKNVISFECSARTGYNLDKLNDCLKNQCEKIITEMDKYNNSDKNIKLGSLDKNNTNWCCY